MRYVCTRCGEILSEENAVTDPDGDIECEACYLENKSEWFTDEEDTKVEENKPERKGYFTSDSLNYGSGSSSEKKGFWKN